MSKRKLVRSITDQRHTATPDERKCRTASEVYSSSSIPTRNTVKVILVSSVICHRPSNWTHVIKRSPGSHWTIIRETSLGWMQLPYSVDNKLIFLQSWSVFSSQIRYVGNLQAPFWLPLRSGKNSTIELVEIRRCSGQNNGCQSLSWQQLILLPQTSLPE